MVDDTSDDTRLLLDPAEASSLTAEDGRLAGEREGLMAMAGSSCVSSALATIRRLLRACSVSWKPDSSERILAVVLSACKGVTDAKVTACK